MPSGHRTLAGTVLFLNQVLPVYLLATCHHIPVTCSTSEIVKCTPDARPESPPRSVWPGVRPREGSGSASAVQVTRNESQVSRKAVAGSQRPHWSERNAPTATRGNERARAGEAGQRGPRSRPAARQLAHGLQEAPLPEAGTGSRAAWERWFPHTSFLSFEASRLSGYQLGSIRPFTVTEPGAPRLYRVEVTATGGVG